MSKCRNEVIFSTLDPSPSIFMGQIYVNNCQCKVGRGKLVMVAQIGPQVFALISLVNGNRHFDGQDLPSLIKAMRVKNYETDWQLVVGDVTIKTTGQNRWEQE